MFVMKKLLLVSALAFLLTATPVLADKDQGKDIDNDNDDSVTASQSCDIAALWKNHGSFVSCMAKLHLGGASVSAAAQSDIGKEHDEDESVSPSASPSPTPSSSPSLGVGTSAAVTVEGTKIEINALIQVLQNIITSLQHLL